MIDPPSSTVSFTPINKEELESDLQQTVSLSLVAVAATSKTKKKSKTGSPSKKQAQAIVDNGVSIGTLLSQAHRLRIKYLSLCEQLKQSKLTYKDFLETHLISDLLPQLDQLEEQKISEDSLDKAEHVKRKDLQEIKRVLVRAIYGLALDLVKSFSDRKDQFALELACKACQLDPSHLLFRRYLRDGLIEQGSKAVINEVQTLALTKVSIWTAQHPKATLGDHVRVIETMQCLGYDPTKIINHLATHLDPLLARHLNEKCWLKSVPLNVSFFDYLYEPYELELVISYHQAMQLAQVSSTPVSVVVWVELLTRVCDMIERAQDRGGGVWTRPLRFKLSDIVDQSNSQPLFNQQHDAIIFGEGESIFAASQQQQQETRSSKRLKRTTAPGGDGDFEDEDPLIVNQQRRIDLATLKSILNENYSAKMLKWALDKANTCQSVLVKDAVLIDLPESPYRYESVYELVMSISTKIFSDKNIISFLPKELLVRFRDTVLRQLDSDRFNSVELLNMGLIDEKVLNSDWELIELRRRGINISSSIGSSFIELLARRAEYLGLIKQAKKIWSKHPKSRLHLARLDLLESIQKKENISKIDNVALDELIEVDPALVFDYLVNSSGDHIEAYRRVFLNHPTRINLESMAINWVPFDQKSASQVLVWLWLMHSGLSYVHHPYIRRLIIKCLCVIEHFNTDHLTVARLIDMTPSQQVEIDDEAILRHLAKVLQEPLHRLACYCALRTGLTFPDKTIQLPLLKSQLQPPWSKTDWVKIVFIALQAFHKMPSTATIATKKAFLHLIDQLLEIGMKEIPEITLPGHESLHNAQVVNAYLHQPLLQAIQQELYRSLTLVSLTPVQQAWSALQRVKICNLIETTWTWQVKKPIDSVRDSNSLRTLRHILKLCVDHKLSPDLHDDALELTALAYQEHAHRLLLLEWQEQEKHRPFVMRLLKKTALLHVFLLQTNRTKNFATVLFHLVKAVDAMRWMWDLGIRDLPLNPIQRLHSEKASNSTKSSFVCPDLLRAAMLVINHHERWLIAPRYEVTIFMARTTKQLLWYQLSLDLLFTDQKEIDHQQDDKDIKSEASDSSSSKSQQYMLRLPTLNSPLLIYYTAYKFLRQAEKTGHLERVIFGSKSLRSVLNFDDNFSCLASASLAVACYQALCSIHSGFLHVIQLARLKPLLTSVNTINQHWLTLFPFLDKPKTPNWVGMWHLQDTAPSSSSLYYGVYQIWTPSIFYKKLAKVIQLFIDKLSEELEFIAGDDSSTREYLLQLATLMLDKMRGSSLLMAIVGWKNLALQLGMLYKEKLGGDVSKKGYLELMRYASKSG